MTDYKELIKELRKHGNFESVFGVFHRDELINTAADSIEELLAERDGKKMGMWIGDDDKPLQADQFLEDCPNVSCHCSVCGEWLVASDEYYVKGNYCPNCGARMDRVTE